MRRFVLSTVGTSILTNQIENNDPACWRHILRDSANLKMDELKETHKEVIDELAGRALKKLHLNEAATNRRISAELNGIYGIYNGKLPEESSDEHWLICTDTAQGQRTGELIGKFLGSCGFANVSIFTPKMLSTKDTDSFTAGTKELIRWLEENIPGRRETQQCVIFNLVGGFKSLQGFMNTFGAFYADEVIYIFEAQTADLIRVPRLPIRIDTTVIEKHRLKFAMMAAGELYPRSELQDIPETLLEFVEDNETTYTGLSTWGELIWNRTKQDLLSTNLLQFPRLKYASSFEKDFASTRDKQARLKLQETLAKVSHILEKNGGTFPLTEDHGLKFEKLKRLDGIYTFRVSQGIRVSCSVEGDGLTLRHYGKHDYVY